MSVAFQRQQVRAGLLASCDTINIPDWRWLHSLSPGSIAVPVAAIQRRLAFVLALIYCHVVLPSLLEPWFYCFTAPWFLLHYRFLSMVVLNLVCLPWVIRSFAVCCVPWKIITSPRKAKEDMCTCIVLLTMWAGLWNSNHGSNGDDACVG